MYHIYFETCKICPYSADGIILAQKTAYEKNVRVLIHLKVRQFGKGSKFVVTLPLAVNVVFSRHSRKLETMPGSG